MDKKKPNDNKSLQMSASKRLPSALNKIQNIQDRLSKSSVNGYLDMLGIQQSASQIMDTHSELINSEVLNQSKEHMEELRNCVVYDRSAEEVGRLHKTIKHISGSLDAEREERKAADNKSAEELQHIQQVLARYIASHKHDFLKEVLIAIISALIGVAFTVIATKCGLL